VHAVVPELHPRQGLVPVDFIAHVAQIDDVALVPQTRRVPGYSSDSAWIEQNSVQTHPAAFGLHTRKRA